MIPLGEVVLFMTPRLCSRLELNIEELKNMGIEIYPTNEVYMNMMYGEWTEEECDDVIYAMRKEDFIPPSITFKF